MEIRKYKIKDEKSWLKCRLISFYDSSYYDDVIFEKKIYSNSIDLVAVKGSEVIGFIEIETEFQKGSVCNYSGELGGVISNLGVHPDYRRKEIASTLLHKAIFLGHDMGLRRFEAWTQDDKEANKWYENNGFNIVPESYYLNVYASKQEVIDNNLISEDVFIRSLNFEESIDKLEELKKKYKRVHIVKCYELKF